MIVGNSPAQTRSVSRSGARGIVRLLPPPPLFLIQPLLKHIVTKVAKRHPELFSRLGTSCDKRFLIESSNTPFVLLLLPDSENPQLTAHDRRIDIPHDVYISGTFITMLRLIDNQVDSDALFFSRDLVITGDAEASVALRNALDNLDASLVDDIAATLGPFGPPLRTVVDKINRFAESRS